MNLESIQEKEVVNTSTEAVDANISQNIENTDIPLDALLTSKDVCKLLKIDPHTLSTNRKIWSDILPPIRFKGSNLIKMGRFAADRIPDEGFRESSPSATNPQESICPDCLQVS